MYRTRQHLDPPPAEAAPAPAPTPIRAARAYARLGDRDGAPDPAPPGPADNDAFVAAEPAATARGEAARAPIAAAPVDWSALFRLDIDSLIGWLLAGMRTIVAIAVLGAAAGLLFGMFTPARYTAYTDILVDPANLQVVADDLFTQSAARDAQLLEVESKLRVLVSGNVLGRVVDDLGLVNDLEFAGRPSLLDIRGLLFGREEGDARLGALRALGDRVDAVREERSFVVTLAVESEDPQKSVVIADAVVAAFQDELAAAEAAGAGRAAAALADRLAELEASVNAAEERTETFRRENGLSSFDGELYSSQTMAQLNTRLGEARARLIDAESVYAELTAPGADVAARAASLPSTTLGTLRAQQSSLRQQADALSATYGPRHPNLLAIQPQLQALDAAVAQETARFVEQARTELEQARSVVASLEAQTAATRSSVDIDGAALVRLRELEREAAAAAAVYESFLARSLQVAERQGIDTTNVRVISPALPPESRSYPPRTLLLIAAGGIAGIGLGVAIALGLGLLGRFRTFSRQADAGSRENSATGRTDGASVLRNGNSRAQRAG